ncbi:ESX secretion-associated protein EspG [Mycobacterium heidelbergense]|uniref:ESX secretion-associated protein EspG n=1 Tax=Mycobacterium heidelbergense TaxID=53376 RepID=UPI003CE832BB
MSAALTSQRVLSDDELQVVASRTGVGEFPTVLDVRPRHSRTDSLGVAIDQATRALTARGLITDGVVDPDLASQVRALHRPDRELAMRVVAPVGLTRVSVVRQNSKGLLARRDGNKFSMRVHGAELSDAIQALLGELPPMPPAPIEPVGAPLDAMTECLDDGGEGPQLAGRIHALGTERRAAMLLGSALSSRLAFAEVVYNALARDEDRISRCPAAVAVFYTKRGRIVAGPTASPSGELWTTLKAGSDHTIAQAIGQLIELSTERWEEA